MNRQTPRARPHGFSLTELLIVIVIVGVLSAIGLPAYQDYSRKSKRSDAHQGLSRIAQLQEKFFTENNRFAAVVTDLGYADPDNDGETISTGGYWDLSVEVGGGAEFTLLAEPSDTHKDDECDEMRLDHTGLRTPPACWSGR